MSRRIIAAPSLSAGARLTAERHGRDRRKRRPGNANFRNLRQGLHPTGLGPATGRAITSSGTAQAETLSGKLTASAMSSGCIISSAGTACWANSVMSVARSPDK